jgi:hypothetical protein
MLWPGAFTSHIKFQNEVLKEGAGPAAEKTKPEWQENKPGRGDCINVPYLISSVRLMKYGINP